MMRAAEAWAVTQPSRSPMSISTLYMPFLAEGPG